MQTEKGYTPLLTRDSTRFALRVEPPYAFAQSVRDHGWSSLAPFQWLPDQNALQRVERLETGRVVLLHIAARADDDAVHVDVAVHAAAPLVAAEQAEIRRTVRWMLKLDEDLTPFYTAAQRHAAIWRAVRAGRGRLLRAPTLWEDVVKTIATTNVTWTNTKNMVQRLVDQMGDPFPLAPTRRAFPTPQQVAAADPALFADVIRMGYRNAYVRQLAQEIASGTRELESLKEANLSPAELKHELKRIKGVGDYAAHTLLMLLGHYGELAIDSELRNVVSQRYFDGETVSDDKLAAVYADWGEWKYLAFWFDGSAA